MIVMAGWREPKKQCFKCGEEIRGAKDYCEPCHEKVLKKLKKRRRRKI
jgi:predicted nucleic acid-binding Zn ribbon protein